MSKLRCVIPLLLILLAGCNLGGNIPSSPGPESGKTAAVPGGKSCGDGICDAAERTRGCAQDCGAGVRTLPPDSGQESAKSGELAAGPSADTYWMVNPSSGAKLFVLVSYPDDGGTSALPAVILIPGGLGAQDLDNDVGQDAEALAAAGYAVIQFDADGRGQSEGKEDYNGFIHQDGLAALILAAGGIPRVDPARIGLISRSYGVTMASGALGRYPDLPVRFYIDWEGPANRNDTATGCIPHSKGIQWPSCEDEAFWAEREAENWIGRARVPYQRIQSAKDHVQPDTSNAVDMINAAVQGGVPWVRLNDNPPGQTYDPVHPPEMFPDTIDRALSGLFIRYSQELLALSY